MAKKERKPFLKNMRDIWNDSVPGKIGIVISSPIILSVFIIAGVFLGIFLVGIAIWLALFFCFLVIRQNILLWKKHKLVVFFFLGWITALVITIIIFSTLFFSNRGESMAIMGITISLFSALFIAYIMEKRAIGELLKMSNKIRDYFLEKLIMPITKMLGIMAECREFMMLELGISSEPSKCPWELTHEFRYLLAYAHQMDIAGISIPPVIEKKVNELESKMGEFKKFMLSIHDDISRENFLKEKKSFHQSEITNLFNLYQTLEQFELQKDKIEMLCIREERDKERTGECLERLVEMLVQSNYNMLLMASRLKAPMKYNGEEITIEKDEIEKINIAEETSKLLDFVLKTNN